MKRRRSRFDKATVPYMKSAGVPVLSELACAHWPRRHRAGSKNEAICADREQRKADAGHEFGRLTRRK